MVLENEGRRMEMVGCACVVTDGTGRSLQRPSAGTGLPGMGLLGGQKDAVILLDVYP